MLKTKNHFAHFLWNVNYDFQNRFQPVHTGILYAGAMWSNRKHHISISMRMRMCVCVSCCHCECFHCSTLNVRFIILFLMGFHDRLYPLFSILFRSIIIIIIMILLNAHQLKSQHTHSVLFYEIDSLIFRTESNLKGKWVFASFVLFVVISRNRSRKRYGFSCFIWSWCIHSAKLC